MNKLPVIAVSLLLASIVAISSCGGGSYGLDSQPLPPPTLPTTDVQRVFSQLTFNSPVALVQAPGDDTQWFAVEQSGVIRVFDNDPTASSSTVFVDISGRVDSVPFEAGLLGIAFDPAFPIVDEVYLSYTQSGAPLVSVISRFTIDAVTGNLDAASEFEILTENPLLTRRVIRRTQSSEP